jgi:hypothetical protein
MHYIQIYILLIKFIILNSVKTNHFTKIIKGNKLCHLIRNPA